MKNILVLIVALLIFQNGYSQITITAADMPIAGDTLRYSFAAPIGVAINPADSGAGINWNYALTPVNQAIDTYQTAMSVNPLYVLTIGLTAYGYKVADSSPFPIPFPGVPSIQNIYTFFEKKTSPARYQAKAFAANIAGIPTPINYSKPDVLYFFPLSYLNNDSAGYKLSIVLPSFGAIKQVGYRKTRVDGWGTITTPYYTTPINCIRVRSEIHEIDSVSFGAFPAIGFPRNSVEYKWLVNGDHYPALWVTSSVGPGGAETVNNVRYRDNPLPDTTPVDNSVRYVSNNIMHIKAFPNPAADGVVTLDIPKGWKGYEVVVYDMRSKQVAGFKNTQTIDIHELSAGQYFGRITSGTNTAYVQITR